MYCLPVMAQVIVPDWRLDDCFVDVLPHTCWCKGNRACIGAIEVAGDLDRDGTIRVCCIRVKEVIP